MLSFVYALLVKELTIALRAAGFDPMQKIRFRSSTNVEDAQTFVGAGLYAYLL